MSENKGAFKFAIGVFVLIMALVLGFCSMHIVSSGHRGIVKVFGSVQEQPLEEGIHFLNPLATVHDFDVRYQSATAAKAEGSTSDMQEVYVDLTANYSYDPKHSPYVYQNFGSTGTIEEKFIIPALYESFKGVTSKYTAEELVTKRALVSQGIISAVQNKLGKYKIIVSDINIQNFAFDKTFAEAVRRKVVAGQNRLTAEQALETAKIATQQKVVEAEGEAKAIAIRSQAVESQGGDKFIALEAIKKWDGKLPEQMFGATVPFINTNKK